MLATVHIIRPEKREVLDERPVVPEWEHDDDHARRRQEGEERVVPG